MKQNVQMFSYFILALISSLISKYQEILVSSIHSGRTFVKGV